MGRRKEGGDCWGEGRHIKWERAGEGASGGQTRRKEHFHKDHKLLQTEGKFISFNI